MTDPSPGSEAAHVAAARRLLQPSPVRAGVLPAWFEQAIGPLFASSEERELQRFPIALTGDVGSLDLLGVRLDHWGSTIRNGREAFVTEVYDLHAEDLAAAEALASAIGCEWQLCANSWHYPGETFRLVFFEFEDRSPASDSSSSDFRARSGPHAWAGARLSLRPASGVASARTFCGSHRRRARG